MKNDERYTKYSAFSFWEKKTYYNQIYVFLKWLNLEYPGFNTWYDNLFTENKELKSGREIIICEKEYSWHCNSEINRRRTKDMHITSCKKIPASGNWKKVNGIEF